MSLPEFEMKKDERDPRQSQNIRIGWRSWLAIAGFAVAVISLGLAIYFYEQSRREPIPIFIVDPTRTQILSASSISQSPVEVFKTNGERVEGDLTSIRFYFWNHGKDPIQPDDVLDTLRVEIEDSASIVDFTVIGETREYVDFSLSRNHDNPNRVLNVSFRVLNHLDGASCQILFEGPNDASLSLTGVIVGAPTIYTSVPFGVTTVVFGYGRIFLGYLPLIAIVLLIEYHNKVLSFPRRVVVSLFPGHGERVLNLAGRVFAVSVAVIIIAVFAFLLLVGPYMDVQSRATEGVDYVPRTLRP